MSEEITYKINKKWSITWKEELLTLLIIEICILTHNDFLLPIFCAAGLIFVLIYDIYLKKQIVGTVIINTDSIKVSLYDKEYFINSSNIDKLNYWGFGFSDYPKIVYKNGEDFFQIRSDQTKLKKMKKTIEEKMGIKIRYR